MELKEGAWESWEGHETKLFTVTHKQSGFFITLTDFGARPLRVVLPDKHGVQGDIALTQESPEVLVKFNAYQGATVGRTANRIENGTFYLDGHKYECFINASPNSIHGGKKGFDQKIWKVESKHVTLEAVTLVFSYVSPDMEEGYPGKLTTTVKYTIQPLKISWEFEAVTDKTTIVSLINHGYWNLDGLCANVNDQYVQIPASTYGLTDKNGLFTGQVQPIDPGLDCRIPKKFVEIFLTFGDADHNLFLDDAKNWIKNQRNLHFVAEAYSPKTGRAMKIHSSEPCVQLYTGNSLGINDFGIITTNGNHKAEKHYAFCLETQRPPNAVNNQFRDYVILHPGETYYHKTEHEFSIIEKPASQQSVKG